MVRREGPRRVSADAGAEVRRAEAAQLSAKGLTQGKYLSSNGKPTRWAVVLGTQAGCRSDDDTVMGIFGPRLTRPRYREWLRPTVADPLDDDLPKSSADLLRGA